MRSIHDVSVWRSFVAGLVACATFLGVAVAPDCAMAGAAKKGKPFPPSELVGRWTGEARIIVSWCQQKKLPIDITIASDGAVAGTIGDAKLKNARIKKNRGFLGRLFHIKTDYIIRGELVGPIVAREKITRKSLSIPFNLVEGELRGGLTTSGSWFGGKEKMELSASKMALKKWKPQKKGEKNRKPKDKKTRNE